MYDARPIGGPVAPANPSSRKQIVTYLVLVLVFSCFYYFLVFRSGSLRYGRGMYVLGLMWCPALAAFATLKLNGRRLADLGWGWGAPKYQWASWYIPLLYTAIAYAIVWIADGAPSATANLRIRWRRRCTFPGRSGFPSGSDSFSPLLWE